jgi:small subunit ribosomal protein S5
LSVSTQGAKKGRGRGRAGNQRKNLNIGQEIGTGKIKVEWPGLNAPLLKERKLSDIVLLGEDTDRETRLQGLRSKMDKFRRLSIPAHERGFTGGTLNGKSIGLPSEDTESNSLFLTSTISTKNKQQNVFYLLVDFTGFDTRILESKIVATVTSILGKKRTSSCFVVTGNGKGVIGFGSGKGSFSSAAIRLAKTNASKRLLKIDLFEDRTLFHNFYQEYYYTKIYAERKPAGYGLKCHRVIKLICELLGLKDIHVKMDGSMNVRNMAKAFLNGLLKQVSKKDNFDEKCVVSFLN